MKSVQIVPWGQSRSVVQVVGSALPMMQKPSFVWQTADDVVRESLAAYDKGEAMLVPGIQNKVTMALTSVIPKTMLVSLAGRFGRQPAH